VIEPITLEFTVACSAAHAFEVWTRRTTSWWPSTHSVSQDAGLTVTIEPRVGGRIYERTPDGSEHDWGEVTRWEPPSTFAYRWHLRQDIDDATEVAIGFSDIDEGACVTIVHAGWEQLGDRAPGLRERNTQGWAGVLPSFRRVCEA
jgi:Activator of Hsp90 ATPase homolog 1-like protein